MIEFWLHIEHPESQIEWYKKMSASCLPPVGCTIFLKLPRNHDTGWVQVDSIFYDENEGIYTVHALIDDEFDYKAYGFKRGAPYDRKSKWRDADHFDNCSQNVPAS